MVLSQLDHAALSAAERQRHNLLTSNTVGRHPGAAGLLQMPSRLPALSACGSAQGQTDLLQNSALQVCILQAVVSGQLLGYKLGFSSEGRQ